MTQETPVNHADQAVTDMAAISAADAPGPDAESHHTCAKCSGQDARQEEGHLDLAPESGGRSGPLVTEPELASAVNMLAQIALQMDDPVQGLEDGVDALAEALVARQVEAQQQDNQRRLAERQREAGMADLHEAYRHARLHRVGELIDVGYGLDQAIAIANANEAEIRQRSEAAGRDPNAVIYEYAVRHGYRPRPPRNDVRRPASAPVRRPTTTVLERLASLTDEEFAEATRGDRWAQLLKSR